MAKPIYLDYNATTPHDPEVIEVMRPFLEEHFGNPASPHSYGMITKNAIEKARIQVAQFLSCDPEEVVFTSGGTESNNLAIKGYVLANQNRGNHLIISSIEHPAVTEVCRSLEVSGFDITILPVNSHGNVEPGDVEQAIRPGTLLISVMHANNETGVIQPIREIAALAISRHIAVHTDAAQSAGKIPVDVAALGVDLLSVAGHKLYGPKGIGVLYVKKGVLLGKIMQGAGQESGFRPGTPNIMGIVGLGKAAEVAGRDMQINTAHHRRLRDELYRGLMDRLQENIHLNGAIDTTLPNTLNVSFKGILAHELVRSLEDDVIVSAGAACHSGIVRITEVMKAMKVPEIWARGAVRISIGKFTTEDEIERAISYITRSYSILRKE